MARIAFAALLLACLAGAALAGPCQFVDGDCKPNAKEFKAPAKGAAANWVKLLNGFAECKTRAAAACSGICTTMPGKGCTLTPAARREMLGTLAPTFAACTKLTGAACAAPNCKVGDKGACVIAAPGVISTFGLTTNLPSAIPILRACKMMVANPKACDA